ncbi:2-oxoisovalerate dehydrogenase E1 subunit beta [Dyella lipolytica]|uniref:2-oxoisovalerate dehydrogenase n=1 Tax=Dyella lipolytica TaxID=1867835 RepID=A0ABW8IVQ4_9GAMM|nr:hypothetical protein [Dyella lipolytica]GLQ46721.1 2-oxoisovalerate dehydrogenase E1 subunit beta [Dyella lipolytica]
MSEIVFLVENAADGRLTARALNHSIYTEADTYEELRDQVREAVRCHFKQDQHPTMIRLYYVKDEVLTV